MEGPYGDHTGYYNSVEPFPVMQLTAITMRRDPIYLSTFTGRPPDEPSRLGEAFNDIFLPVARRAFPDQGSLAAAGSLLLPDRGGIDQQALSGPGTAADDGAVVDAAAVQLHQAPDHRRRRRQCPRLGRRDVGGLDPLRSVARPGVDRRHPDRLSRLRFAESRALAANSGSTPPTRSAPRPRANGARC